MSQGLPSSTNKCF